jgi:hypothetical protein
MLPLDCGRACCVASRRVARRTRRSVVVARPFELTVKVMSVMSTIRYNPFVPVLSLPSQPLNELITSDRDHMSLT